MAHRDQGSGEDKGPATGGLVLAEKAARDLGVGVGDQLTVEHPQATATGLRTARTTMPVAGLHPNPMRMLAYLDPSSADAFGLTGMANILTVHPATGSGPDAVRRALLTVPHVASAQSAQATTEGMRASLEEFVGILQVAALVTLLLALLIAFNTTSIGADERAREHATMLAFGLPARTVLGMTTAGTVLVGALGTITGLAGGYAMLRWLTATTIPSVLPELGVFPALSSTTITAALALGILTVAPGTAPHPSTPPPATRSGTGCPARATGRSTESCTSWPPSSCAMAPKVAPTSIAGRRPGARA